MKISVQKRGLNLAFLFRRRDFVSRQLGEVIGVTAVTVSIIAAMSRNRVIGRDGAIPWNMPADMSKFRDLTRGHTVIMGRKTFESIGRPLPGRKNIVVTRQPDYPLSGALTAASLDAALRLAEEDGEVFICGGGDIYAQALPYAARIYLTVADFEAEGDIFFPCIPADDFVELTVERLSVDPPADFILLVRRTLLGKACAG